MPKIASLIDLPVEIVECIVAKCQENDIELLVDDYKTVIAREDAAATTNADETGWETEEEEDDNEDEEDSEEDMEANFIDPWGPDPSGLYHDKLFCERCEEYHRPAPKYCPVVRDLQPSTPSVHQLALTCKFLRKLALPYIYESVDFETLSNEVMERYLEVIVPKYGQHVKDFWARISTNENSEFFPVGASAAEDPALFEPEKRFQVTMEILRNLPNLVSIDIDITILLQGRTEELLNNIKSRGSTLQGLHLTADAMSLRFTSTQLCPVLEALPNIKHLEITGIDRDSEGAPSLRDTIAKMSQLTCLDLADAHCVQDDWAQADWQCQLRAIDLDDCQHISGKGVEDLILRHAATLRHISLNATPYQQIDDFNTGKPFDLPLLETLALDDFQFDFDTLKRFELCPKLMRLELGTMDEMDPKQLTELIERPGFEALKEIMLSSDWPAPYEDVNFDTLELVCYTKKIALERDRPDTSDEEDYEDDMSFDGDEPDQEFWDEGFSEDEDEEATDEEFDEDDSETEYI